MALTYPLWEGTNNKAEIEAACYWLTWVLEMGYKNIVLVVDLLLVVIWILGKAIP